MFLGSSTVMFKITHNPTVLCARPFIHYPIRFFPSMFATTASRSFASFLEPPSKKISLGSLADNKGATKKRTRLGRGPGSGKGKTAGRGHKGQNARSGNGKPTPVFEGGQMPLVKRLPKRGFHNLYVLFHGKSYQPLNLDRLQHWIDTGRIDPLQPITMKHLLDTRCVHKLEDGVKLLSDGGEYFKTRVNIVVSRASHKAIEDIEQAGGTIVCQYYHPLGLRALRFPEKFAKIPKTPLPSRPKEKEWYQDPQNRGYLASPDDIKMAREKVITNST
ncbi:ribosomal protein L18e/L15P [Endogone sp. FLAS-F59071]|nr:ribosomal protein L18e/L15P [Endogone sp. FLAS-F59071]|eukprot:RUS21003.1 ribosomal protein L18e/L15P [Endogone sp. FLAS-F59071]